jgi:cell division septation protein DedD
MDHVVFYAGPDAAPGYRLFSSLDEAVRFVEHMRNVEGVEDVSVNLLTPVPLAFRAYYKVEVPPVETPPAEVAAVPEQPLAAEPVMPEPVEAVPVDAVPVEVPAPAEPASAANGKRSLGFFAH